MSAGLRPVAPPYETDGRRHPEHPLESAVRACEDRGPDSDDYLDLGELAAEARERAAEQSTGVEDLLGVDLDLDEATAPFVQLDDDNEPTERIEAPWYARAAS